MWLLSAVLERRFVYLFRDQLHISDHVSVRYYEVDGRGIVIIQYDAHPKRVLTWATVAFVASLGLGALLPVNLFPSPSQGEFTFSIRLPEGTALPVTDRTLTRLAALVEKDSRVKFVYTSAGQRDLAAFSGSALEANRGQLTVVMKKATDRKGEEAVAATLRDAMGATPGLGYEFEIPALLKFKNPVEVEVFAYDLDTLRTLSSAVAAQVASVRGVHANRGVSPCRHARSRKMGV